MNQVPEILRKSSLGRRVSFDQLCRRANLNKLVKVPLFEVGRRLLLKSFTQRASNGSLALRWIVALQSP
jgi:hypothetical protein